MTSTSHQNPNFTLFPNRNPSFCILLRTEFDSLLHMLPLFYISHHSRLVKMGIAAVVHNIGLAFYMNFG